MKEYDRVSVAREDSSDPLDRLPSKAVLGRGVQGDEDGARLHVV
jgi:hypothetical protein